MLTPLEINQEELLHKLNSKYDIGATDIDFVPKGEASWVYIVRKHKNNQWLLKVHKAKNLSSTRFRILHDLYTKAGIENITHPIPNKENSLEFKLKGYPTALFNYIEGKTAIEQPLTEKHYEKLGELLGQIHRAKKVINYAVKEDFNVPKEEFLSVIDYLENSRTASTTQQEAINLLKPIQSRLLRQLENLKKLEATLQNSPPDFVLCHGEPSPGNIMVTPNNKVYLIDWDEPIMAPKEKDLLFFDKTLTPLLRGYAKYSNDRRINKTAVDFYKHAWNIAEIADWGNRLFLNPSTNNEETSHALSQLKHFLEYSELKKQ